MLIVQCCKCHVFVHVHVCDRSSSLIDQLDISLKACMLGCVLVNDLCSSSVTYCSMPYIVHTTRAGISLRPSVFCWCHAGHDEVDVPTEDKRPIPETQKVKYTQFSLN